MLSRRKTATSAVMNRTSSASTFANPELFGAASYQANNVQQKPQNLQFDPEFRRHDWQIYISTGGGNTN
jgi:hypothetical protein